MMKPTILICAVLLIARPSFAAEDLGARLLAVEDRWAQIRYDMKEKSERLAAAHALVADTEGLVSQHPGRAEPLAWHAQALLVEAEIRGDVSALKLVKEARGLLERADAIDPAAGGGLIQTSLGMVYYETPRWPIAFGDKKRAGVYLTRALEIDPDGRDANYFYGDYLLQTGRGREAMPFLEKALKAPVRPGHERADNGRMADIQEALDKARRAR